MRDIKTIVLWGECQTKQEKCKLTTLSKFVLASTAHVEHKKSKCKNLEKIRNCLKETVRFELIKFLGY